MNDFERDAIMRDLRKRREEARLVDNVYQALEEFKVHTDQFYCGQGIDRAFGRTLVFMDMISPVFRRCLAAQHQEVRHLESVLEAEERDNLPEELKDV